MRRFKSVLTLLLLVLLAVASPGPGVRATDSATSPLEPASNVDRQVWAELAAGSERRAAFVVVMHEPVEGDPASAIEAQMSLEGPLEALERAGSIGGWSILYGANAVVVTGSRSAALFLAGRPDVASIRLPRRDEAAEATVPVQAVVATGQITGQVTGPDASTALPGIAVTAYRQFDPISWVVAGTATTSDTGAYTIGGLSTGIYRARFRDPSGEYVGEYYNNQRTWIYATNFNVTDGQSTPGISASLAQAGRIAGRVTKLSGGGPIADIAVTAWYLDGAVWVNAGGGVTGGGGDYVVGGLAPGAYRVKFDDVYSPARYVPEYYDNKGSVQVADDVYVTAGDTTPGIDAALGGYGKITGAVTGPDGIMAISGVDVDVWTWNPSWLDWEWVSYGTTDASGNYVANGLVTGDYRVEFSDSLDQLATEFYDDQPDIGSGTDVHAELGATTPGIDALLDLAVMQVDLPLVDDWNLISLSLTPSNPDPGVVLSPIDGDYERIWAYDGCDTSDPWKIYDPDVPASDLDALGEKQGYWLLATRPVTLTVSGTRPLVTDIPLCEGWNLFGYPSGVSPKIADALAGIEGAYDLVYGYKADQPDDPWKKYDPDAPFGNDLKRMEPGFGYWIRMTEPATLTIDSR